jgi:hypothetical protein
MARTRAEIGSIGLPIFSGRVTLDPNAKLRGLQGIRIFREMAHDEPAAAAFLQAAYNLLRYDLQVEPGGTTANDQRATAFLASCLDDMRDPVATQLRQMYSMLWAGWSVSEIVYKRRPDGSVGWAAWAPRRQESFERWGYDTKTGRVTSFVQRPAPTYDLREIPLRKCVHLVADDSEGSPEGRSPFRAMYRQGFFVKNLELLLGISLERFGTGVPVFQTQPGVPMTEDALTSLEEIASALRQNENAYVILPAGIEFRFAPSPGLDAGHYLEAIRRMRTWMLATVLADFIALGTDGGAYALGKDKTELFLLALNGLQDRLLTALNRQAVAPLFRYNDFGNLTALPRLSLPAVRRYDLAGLASFAEILHRLGALHVTPADEAMFRKVSDLVDIDPATLEAAFTESVVGDGEDAPMGAAEQIFGYHIEQGIVEDNEARGRLGLPPRSDAQTKAQLRNVQARLAVVREALQSGYTPEEARRLAGMPEDGTPPPPPTPATPSSMPEDGTAPAQRQPAQPEEGDLATGQDAAQVADDDVEGTEEREVSVGVGDEDE